MSNICILIIAHSGANLDSLSAVLPALVQDVELSHAIDHDDVSAILKENQPRLVLIDNDIGYRQAKLLYEMITTRFPEVAMIILSDAEQWQRWKTISNAHQVLLKGFSTRRLKAMLVSALKVQSFQ
jgi:DNA-binding NtrC family response regulator